MFSGRDGRGHPVGNVWQLGAYRWQQQQLRRQLRYFLLIHTNIGGQNTTSIA